MNIQLAFLTLLYQLYVYWGEIYKEATNHWLMTQRYQQSCPWYDARQLY